MPYDLVNTVTIRPDGIAEFLEQVSVLAESCRKKRDHWTFTAHETLFGEGLTMHFASRADSFEALEELGTVEELWLRALGEKRGTEGFLATNCTLQGARQTVSADRPDLSYVEGLGNPTDYPYAVVTAARTRPGHAETAEELIRKLAEGIPKVGDPTRMLAYQVIFGDMGAYWTVRPLRRLADLDQQLPAPDLLDQAFGRSEGGLIWRAGQEAIQEARREVVRYRPELSNPPTG